MPVSDSDGIEWLRSLRRFGERPGLERIRSTLQACGNPQEELRFIHVAGTNGKGSVCAYLTALFSTTMRVGTFTSPSFDGYRGRFVIAGETIGPDEFSELAADTRNMSELANPGDSLTEFEALTVMAILYFRRHQVDLVVWETGMGGRYDSTNVVTPVVSVITNVSLDHMEVLGSTVGEIAYDKAGIIKASIPVVTAAQDEAWHVLRRVADESGSSLISFRQDFGAVREVITQGGQTVHYRGIHRDFWNVTVPLFGSHQTENAAVALATYEVACGQDVAVPLSDEVVRAAMASAVWPGRFEIVRSGRSTVVLDGAHNPDGARKFADSLREFGRLVGFRDEPVWTMIIGVLTEKDVSRMLSPLLPLAARVVVTKPDNPRAKPVDAIVHLIKTMRPGLPTVGAETVPWAIQVAAGFDGPIAVWGSLYTVDEARKAMQQ